MFEREVNQDNVTQADIVVGLASYNEADCISYPTRQSSLGLKKYYPEKDTISKICFAKSSN